MGSYATTVKYSNLEVEDLAGKDAEFFFIVVLSAIIGVFFTLSILLATGQKGGAFRFHLHPFGFGCRTPTPDLVLPFSLLFALILLLMLLKQLRIPLQIGILG
jgi:hypothetical protein